MYAEYLRRLLRPLGVYELSPSSYSGAMPEALGAAMDDAESVLDTVLRESIPATAEGEGLSKRERLFPFAAVGGTAAQRRAALAGFFQISGDSFTAEALQRCLSACGTSCLVTETATPLRVQVSFPGVMGIPDEFPARQAIIESILPCHLEIDYVFRWCTWRQTAQLGLTWGELADNTWGEWAVLPVEA